MPINVTALRALCWSILAGVDKIPDSWLDKIPYFQSEEQRRAKKDKRSGRKSSSRSISDESKENERDRQKSQRRRSVDYRAGKEGSKAKGRQRRDNDEDDPSEEDQKSTRPRYERRRTHSVDEYVRRHDRDYATEDRRPFQPVFAGRYGDYDGPSPMVNTSRQATTGYNGYSSYGPQTARPALATDYVPYADVYSSPVSSQPPSRRGSVAPSPLARENLPQFPPDLPGSQPQSRRESFSQTAVNRQPPIFASQYTKEPRYLQEGYAADSSQASDSWTTDRFSMDQFNQGGFSRRGSTAQSKGRRGSKFE